MTMQDLRDKLITFFNEKEIDYYDPSRNTKALYRWAVRNHKFEPLDEADKILIGIDAEKEAEKQPETEPETEPENESETEPEIEPETEPETEPENESETEPEIEPETEPETEPENEPEKQYKKLNNLEDKIVKESEKKDNTVWWILGLFALVAAMFGLFKLMEKSKE
jgi:FtsZ-interacting cell division protein ZipA